jgi:hypothetical protein
MTQRLRAAGGQVDAQPAGTEHARTDALRQARGECREYRGRVRRSFPRRTCQDTEQIILDLDATDDPLHGHQERRFFHDYYDCYCYLPLYVFCGRHLLAAKLRRSNIDASAGTVEPQSGALAARARAAAWRQRLRPRGADGLVRGQPGGFPVRPGPQ